jgi:hypothetical protein
MSKLLVTGGAGFVGSALIRQLIDETESTVVNVDSLTYAGSLESLARAGEHPRHIFERVDIRERPALSFYVTTEVARCSTLRERNAAGVADGRTGTARAPRLFSGLFPPVCSPSRCPIRAGTSYPNASDKS